MSYDSNQLLNFSIIENIFFKQITKKWRDNSLKSMISFLSSCELILINDDDLNKFKTMSIYLKSQIMLKFMHKVNNKFKKRSCDMYIPYDVRMSLSENFYSINQYLNDLTEYFNKTELVLSILKRFSKKINDLKFIILDNLEIKNLYETDTFSNELQLFTSIFEEFEQPILENIIRKLDNDLHNEIDDKFDQLTFSNLQCLAKNLDINFDNLENIHKSYYDNNVDMFIEGIVNYDEDYFRLINDEVIAIQKSFNYTEEEKWIFSVKNIDIEFTDESDGEFENSNNKIDETVSSSETDDKIKNQQKIEELKIRNLSKESIESFHSTVSKESDKATLYYSMNDIIKENSDDSSQNSQSTIKNASLNKVKRSRKRKLLSNRSNEPPVKRIKISGELNNNQININQGAETFNEKKNSNKSANKKFNAISVSSYESSSSESFKESKIKKINEYSNKKIKVVNVSSLESSTPVSSDSSGECKIQNKLVNNSIGNSSKSSDSIETNTKESFVKKSIQTEKNVVKSKHASSSSLKSIINNVNIQTQNVSKNISKNCIDQKNSNRNKNDFLNINKNKPKESNLNNKKLNFYSSSESFNCVNMKSNKSSCNHGNNESKKKRKIEEISSSDESIEENELVDRSINRMKIQGSQSNKDISELAGSSKEILIKQSSDSEPNIDNKPRNNIDTYESKKKRVKSNKEYFESSKSNKENNIEDGLLKNSSKTNIIKANSFDGYFNKNEFYRNIIYNKILSVPVERNDNILNKIRNIKADRFDNNNNKRKCESLSKEKPSKLIAGKSGLTSKLPRKPAVVDNLDQKLKENYRKKHPLKSRSSKSLEKYELEDNIINEKRKCKLFTQKYVDFDESQIIGTDSDIETSIMKIPDVIESISIDVDKETLSEPVTREKNGYRRKVWSVEESSFIYLGLKANLSWAQIKEKYFRHSTRTNINIKDRWRNIEKDKNILEDIKSYLNI